jgi:hypothetical protein
MPEFNGKFQYQSGGRVTQEGPCRVQFDHETFTLSPESGLPIVFDLGDADAVTGADYEVRVPLYTGSTLALRQFGKAYETLAHDLLEAFRKRAVECLLLEDMEEVERFNGTIERTHPGSTAQSGLAELRLYKSNLAILPSAAQPFQWRLAEIGSVQFDSAKYEVVLSSGDEQLKVKRLAKRTEEFVSRVRDAVNALAAESAQALHSALPFLNPDQLQSANALMREGRSASLAKLSAIHHRISAALAANAVDTNLKPYYEKLAALSVPAMQYAGFKIIRNEEDSTGADDASGAADESASSASNAAGADSAGPETLYWFFFPLADKPGSSQPANLVAWEASSRSGRATYLFRLVDPGDAGQLRDASRAAALTDAAIGRISRGLGALNFRRRPIYLSDDVLESNPQFHRYAIAARRIPEVRELRSKFVGRALHSSLETWQQQVADLIAKSRS